MGMKLGLAILGFLLVLSVKGDSCRIVVRNGGEDPVDPQARPIVAIVLDNMESKSISYKEEYGFNVNSDDDILVLNDQVDKDVISVDCEEGETQIYKCVYYRDLDIFLCPKDEVRSHIHPLLSLLGY